MAWALNTGITFRGSVGFLSSAILHGMLVVCLALWTIQSGTDGTLRSEIVISDAKDAADTSVTLHPSIVVEVDQSASSDDPMPREEPIWSELVRPAPAIVVRPAPSSASSVSQPLWALQAAQLSQSTPSSGSGGFAGRSGPLRQQLLAERGGSPATEDAVEKALAWIAAHQLDDGAWSFDHHQLEIGRRSPNPGEPRTATGATGLALLPFLGKGYTHLNENPYRERIAQGLYYLRVNQIVGEHGGDLQYGSMYGHGLATLALCEAYAMTEDPGLRYEATQAIRFIEYAQHDEGGWRYQPKQAGDISVLGWQLMALKSGLLGNIKVSSFTVGMADHFLDQVQSGGGAYYGYQFPGKMASPTSIGLLSRMYLGWQRDDPRLVRGVEYLADLGPSESDMYFNYYATNVLCHRGGREWEAWNEEMKAYLLKTQSRRGYTHGSWYFEDQHAKVGGRLYVTCLSAMILEVYYRHMPLYSEQSLDFTF